MNNKRIALIGALVACLVAALGVFGWKRAADQPSAPFLSVELGDMDDTRQPGIVYYDGTNADEDPFLTEKQLAEMVIDLSRKEFKEQGGDLPEDAVEYLRYWATQAYAMCLKKENRLPRVSDMDTFSLNATQIEKPRTTIVGMDDYDGPQTVEAIMERYDKGYGPWREIDDVFPREEWIQRALDLGVEFRDGFDYTGILGLRRYMERFRSDPSPHFSRMREAKGLEDDANYNAFIDARIQRIARQNIQFREAKRKDPESTGGFFLRDQYIPTRGNQTYVRIDPDDPNHAVVMYGPRDRDLTKEEEHLLKYHGVAPEGIEVFYLDKNSKVMPAGSDPPRLSWEARVSAMSEHERHVALQKTVDFLNSEKVKEMTIVHWMTLADFTGALLDYTDGGRAGVSDAPPVSPVSQAPSGVVAPSEAPSSRVEQELSRLLPPGVELPKSPGKSREDVDAFFDFLDLHLIENADVPENVRRGLKQRYEAYQMWKDQDRLRRQEPAPPSPPSNEDSDTSDEEDDE